MKTIFLIITVYVAVKAEGCFFRGRDFGGWDDHHHHHHDFDRSDLTKAEPSYNPEVPYWTPQYHPEYNQAEDYSIPKTQLYYQTIPPAIPQSQLAPPRSIPIHYPSMPVRNDFNYFEQQHPPPPSRAAGVYPGWYKPDIPVALRLPNSQTVLIPVRAVYTLPSFIERLVQRIQTVYSVYNPPESLTLDRPLPGRPPVAEVQSEERPPVEGEATVPEQEGPQDAQEALPVSPQSTQSMNPKPFPEEEAPGANEVVQPSLASESSMETEEEIIKDKISTLAVFEVTPSTTAGPPPSSSTEEPNETPNKEETKKDSPTEPAVETTPSETDHQTTTMETTTDADNYISPEKIPDEKDLKLLASRKI